MIDEDLRAWLIEVNANPGLSECKSLQLKRILENMMEHVIQIAVDPLFPPPRLEKLKTQYLRIPENVMKENIFELIFDEEAEGLDLPDVAQLRAIEKEVYSQRFLEHIKTGGLRLDELGGDEAAGDSDAS